jgi:hypothetical protein
MRFRVHTVYIKLERGNEMNETVYTIAELRKILEFEGSQMREELEMFIDELEEQVEKFELEMEGFTGS